MLQRFPLAGTWQFWAQFKTWEDWHQVEAMETQGYIDMCLKRQLLQRKEELAEIGKQAKGLVKGQVFEGMPYLVMAFADCSAGDGASGREGQKNIDWVEARRLGVLTFERSCSVAFDLLSAGVQ